MFSVIYIMSIRMPIALHMLSRPSVVVYTENPSHATSILRSRRDRAAGRRHPGNREPSRVPACSRITSNTHTCENVCIYRNIGEPALVTQASSGRLRHTSVKIYVRKGHECVCVYMYIDVFPLLRSKKHKTEWKKHRPSAGTSTARK